MKYFLFSASIVLLFSCTTSSTNQNVNVEREQAYQDSVKQATIINNETVNNAAAKTDNEVIADAVADGVAQIQLIAAEKRKNDSIKRANRDHLWVYQIGLPKSDEDELWKAYERVKGMGGISAFKQSRNSYILIQNKYYSYQQLNDSIIHFNTLLNNIGINEQAKIYDLMAACNKVKDRVIQEENIKAKNGKEIEC